MSVLFINLSLNVASYLQCGPQEHLVFILKNSNSVFSNITPIHYSIQTMGKCNTEEIRQLLPSKNYLMEGRDASTDNYTRVY